MAHLLVAIDPGVNGGIVWSADGDPVECIKMPASDVEVCQLLADLCCKAKDVSLYLEEPPLFAGKNIPGSAIGKLMWNTGVLYGAVTQRDIADQLVVDGFPVDMRAVRLQMPIRRIGSYSCVIQLDRDLKTEIGIEVIPDRTLEILTAAADAPAEEPAEETPAAEAAPAAEDDMKGKKGKKSKD